MADRLLSPRGLFRDVAVNIVSGLIPGAAAGFYSNIWIGSAAFFIIIIAVFFLWLWKKYKRLIKLILSGCAGYYYSFDIEENHKIFENIKKTFCYLGISADSIMEPLRRWIDNDPISGYKILLMKPYSLSLKRQEAFQMGYDIDADFDKFPPESKKNIEIASDATSKRIEGAISILKTTRPYQLGHMQIKLYEEFSPWWMYTLDECVSYIGILEKGKRGSSSPVLVMKKHDQYPSPFDAFKNHWERLWQSAEKIDA